VAGRDGRRAGRDVYHALDEGSFGRPDAEVTDVLDVRDVLAQREAVIAEHRSQTSPFEGLSSVPGARTSGEYWDCTGAAWRPARAESWSHHDPVTAAAALDREYVRRVC